MSSVIPFPAFRRPGRPAPVLRVVHSETLPSAALARGNPDRPPSSVVQLIGQGVARRNRPCGPSDEPPTAA